MPADRALFREIHLLLRDDEAFATHVESAWRFYTDGEHPEFQSLGAISLMRAAAMAGDWQSADAALRSPDVVDTHSYNSDGNREVLALEGNLRRLGSIAASQGNAARAGHYLSNIRDEALYYPSERDMVLAKGLAECDKLEEARAIIDRHDLTKELIAGGGPGVSALLELRNSYIAHDDIKSAYELIVDSVPELPLPVETDNYEDRALRTRLGSFLYDVPGHALAVGDFKTARSAAMKLGEWWYIASAAGGGGPHDVAIALRSPDAILGVTILESIAKGSDIDEYDYIFLKESVDFEEISDAARIVFYDWLEEVIVMAEDPRQQHEYSYKLKKRLQK